MNHELIIPCSKNSLKDIRQFVESTLTGFCVPEMEISMIVLAVDEICANRIIHSNKNNDKLSLRLKIMDAEDGLSFEIMDRGAPFDHNNHEDPSLQSLKEQKRKGGLGLMLVKRIMDSIEVTTENNYTVCRLYKKVSVC